MKRIKCVALFLAAALALQNFLPVSAASPDMQEKMKEENQAVSDETGQKDKQNMQITATVPSAVPSYYISLPETISLGELDSSRDYTKNYEIGITAENLNDFKLKITSDREITYANSEDSEKTLTGYNTFGTQYFTSSGTAQGSLTLYKEDIARVPKGTYTGNIMFYTSLVNEEGSTADGSEGTGETDSSGTVDTGEQTVQKTVAAHLLMEQNGQIHPEQQESMCWPFFHQNADLTLREDGMVDIVLYLIDPIPGENFSRYGTPLTNVYVTGSAADITAEGLASSAGSESDKVTLHPSDDSYASAVTVDHDNQTVKYFVKDRSGGVFVPEAGDYPSAPVRFSVPLPAVKESENGTILLTAYVKPMAVWKQFFLVLDDVDDLENTGGNETDTTEKEYSIEKTPGLDAGVNGLKDYVNAEDTADGFYKFHIKEADSVKDQAGIAAIAALISAGASSGTAAYYEIGLECETTNETTAITDTGSYVMEIRLPLDESRGNTLSVYRCHDGIAGLMQPLSARKTSGYKDNTYYADWTNGYVYLYTSRFSVYSLYQIQDSSSGENGTVTDTGSDTGSDTAGTTENKNGTYTASVSMRKSDNINSVSMCNPLFYSRADLEVSGNSTKVTLYVINPIPSYAGEGTPLSNIKFIVNGSTYSGSIDTVNKVSRYFSTNEQFIPTAGNYYASPITVTIPTSAVENSADGKVKMSAYVNAVMKSTQEFYVVFGNWKSGETQSSGDAAVIDESTSAASSGTAAAATGISAAETTSGSLASGEYLIPVTAIKEKTSDASMMADYMYPKARLVVDGSTSELTVYILHTVAGVEGGGPEWMSYSGVKAEKETNAVKLGGQIYDSFTFTVSGEVPSPMLVTMLINAMKMEVNARLVFDFDIRTTVTGSAEEALEESVEETEKADEVQNEDADMQSAQEDEQSGILSEDAGYQLVTDAWIQGIFILLLTTAATAGIFTLYWHRKRRY